MMGRKVTVGSIVASFQKTIDQLNDQSDRMESRVVDINVQVAVLEDEANECVNEMHKADSIANKLQEIIS